MRPEFRFPRSTVFLMLVSLAGVVLSLEKARTVQVKYGAGATLMSVWPALPWALVLVLLILSATVAITWESCLLYSALGSIGSRTYNPGPNRDEVGRVGFRVQGMSSVLVASLI